MSMADNCSFFDFSQDIISTERRYVVACVKTYDSTAKYLTVKLFKKDKLRDQIQDNKNNCNSDGFRLNQRISYLKLEPIFS